MPALSAGEEAFLEHLGLEPGAPAPRLFEDLFLRFVARVPDETLFPHGGPHPNELIASVLDNGTGLAGLERTRVLFAIGGNLGYDVRPVLGEKRDEEGRAEPHVALLARLENRNFLADLALPLPVLLPLDARGSGIPTAFGRLFVRDAGQEVSLVLEGQGRRREVLRVDLAGDGGAARTALDVREESGRRLARVLSDRALLWRAGALRVSDPWSRLEHALSERDALEALFGLSLEGATLESVERAPGLTVFDATGLAAAQLRARLETPAALLRLQPPGCAIEGVQSEDDGWTWTLVDERGRRSERVRPEPDGALVEDLSGTSPFRSRRFRVAEEAAGTRLTLEAALSKPVPPRGLTESVRKTLVFHLTAELLALGAD